MSGWYEWRSNKERNDLLIEGPMQIEYAGRDVTAWRWFLSGHEVIVEISGTAMEVEDSHLSDRVRAAKRTEGRSEVERLAEWEVPNPLVSLTTDD